MRERPRVTRELTCELDDRTRLEYGTKLVKELDAAARAKAAIKYHQKEAERLVAVLIEGSEIRSVECQEIPSYSDGVMRLCRLDTYETLSERKMTDEERNGNLFAGVDEPKAPEDETNPPENETIAPPETEQTAEGETVEGAQVDPETAAQADADAAIEKQISQEQKAEEDPSGLPPMTEEIATQIENNWGDENPPWKDSQPQAEPEQEPAASPEPVAEVRPRRRKQGRRA